MVVTLLVITGFQLYWLNNNYDRENRTLEIKTNIAFQESVRNLQAAKLKLKEPFNSDTSHKKRMQVFIDEDIPGQRMRMPGPEEEIVTMVNTMRDKLLDSAKKLQKNKSTIFISVNGDTAFRKTDTLTGTFTKRMEGRDRMILSFAILMRVAKQNSAACLIKNLLLRIVLKNSIGKLPAKQKQYWAMHASRRLHRAMANAP